MLQCPPQTQDGVLLSSERVCDVGLADGHVAALGKTTVEAVGNHPAAGLRHEGFEANDFLAHPLGLGMGTEAPNGVTYSTRPPIADDGGAAPTTPE